MGARHKLRALVYDSLPPLEKGHHKARLGVWARQSLEENETVLGNRKHATHTPFFWPCFCFSKRCQRNIRRIHALQIASIIIIIIKQKNVPSSFSHCEMHKNQNVRSSCLLSTTKCLVWPLSSSYIVNEPGEKLLTPVWTASEEACCTGQTYSTWINAPYCYYLVE